MISVECSVYWRRISKTVSRVFAIVVCEASSYDYDHIHKYFFVNCRLNWLILATTLSYLALDCSFEFCHYAYFILVMPYSDLLFWHFYILFKNSTMSFFLENFLQFNKNNILTYKFLQFPVKCQAKLILQWTPYPFNLYQYFSIEINFRKSTHFNYSHYNFSSIF